MQLVNMTMNIVYCWWMEWVLLHNGCIIVLHHMLMHYWQVRWRCILYIHIFMTFRALFTFSKHIMIVCSRCQRCALESSWNKLFFKLVQIIKSHNAFHGNLTKLNCFRLVLLRWFKMWVHIITTGTMDQQLFVNSHDIAAEEVVLDNNNGDHMHGPWTRFSKSRNGKKWSSMYETESK